MTSTNIHPDPVLLYGWYYKSYTVDLINPIWVIINYLLTECEVGTEKISPDVLTVQTEPLQWGLYGQEWGRYFLHTDQANSVNKSFIICLTTYVIQKRGLDFRIFSKRGASWELISQCWFARTGGRSVKSCMNDRWMNEVSFLKKRSVWLCSQILLSRRVAKTLVRTLPHWTKLCHLWRTCTASGSTWLKVSSWFYFPFVDGGKKLFNWSLMVFFAVVLQLFCSLCKLVNLFLKVLFTFMLSASG